MTSVTPSSSGAAQATATASSIKISNSTLRVMAEKRESRCAGSGDHADCSTGEAAALRRLVPSSDQNSSSRAGVLKRGTNWGRVVLMCRLKSRGPNDSGDGFEYAKSIALRI